VFVDGVDVLDVPLEVLRRQMGVVSQEPFLFSNTVAANIAFGLDEPAASGPVRDRVERAAALAGLAQDVEGFPAGYETWVGERGITLSGGQKQRIALARAIVRHPELLILDEATSALDTESERLVQEAIERLLQDRTVLVVAHRLATIRDADEILVLERGRLIERGSHDALFAQSGVYRRLHDLQFRTAEVPV
jgi:ATP-binding cassette subfamily B protein